MEKTKSLYNKLWAPWRSRYIRHEMQSRRCIFCTKPKAKRDRRNYIVYRGKYCYAILNIFPYNNGHVMVAPYRHLGELSDLKSKETLELIQIACRMQKRLKKLKPSAFNMGLNLGQDAGAGFKDHVHLHIVPRWRGDTNFMPILADTKVISQSLDAAYELLTADS